MRYLYFCISMTVIGMITPGGSTQQPPVEVQVPPASLAREHSVLAIMERIDKKIKEGIRAGQFCTFYNISDAPPDVIKDVIDQLKKLKYTITEEKSGLHYYLNISWK